MIPRYRAWDKIHKTMYKNDDIVSIDIEKSQIYVKTPFFEQVNCYSFRDIDLMQSTGFTELLTRRRLSATSTKIRNWQR